MAPADAVTELPGAASLELRDVEFAYPGRRAPGAVRHLLPRRRRRRRPPIIGSTGAGKTTLLNLVPRLFDATAGAVLVDGVDVRDLDPSCSGAAIGLVPQKPYLFSGTVASNLRYGNPDATDDELWEALEIAQARDFVEAMPGSSTPPSPRAAPTSRAGSASGSRSPGPSCASPASTCSTTRSPRSTSPPTPGCAPRSRRSPRDAVTVIVAQRVSTIVHADQILVLEDGRIVGLGTHHELLETCPTYAEIVESQLVAEEAA